MIARVCHGAFLALAACATVALWGCIEEPASPAMSIVAAETSRDASGNVHVSVLVQDGEANEGDSDFEGSFCAKATWFAGVSTSLDANEAGSGAEAIASGTACSTNLAAGASTRLDVQASAPVAGTAFVRVTLDADPEGEPHVVTSPP